MSMEDDNRIEVTTFMLAACKKILRTNTEYIDGALENCDLSPNEVIVLSCLISGPATASHIAQQFEVSKALVSRSVKRLKELGYIRIAISEADKREQSLSLTAEGKKLARNIEEAMERFSFVSMDRLDENQRNALRLLLKIVLKNLEMEAES